MALPNGAEIPARHRVCFLVEVHEHLREIRKQFGRRKHVSVALGLVEVPFILCQPFRITSLDIPAAVARTAEALYAHIHPAARPCHQAAAGLDEFFPLCGHELRDLDGWRKGAGFDYEPVFARTR